MLCFLKLFDTIAIIKTQVVILAAGYGTRMRPLSFHIPKPMIQICGKNLIEHNIDTLPLKKVLEIIIVVGYLKEQVINHFGKKYKGAPIQYAFQRKPLDTGDALSVAAPLIRSKEFIVFMGDDLYSAADFENFINSKGLMIGVKETKEKFSGGKMLFDQNGHLSGIKEGVHKNGGLVNTGLYRIDKDFLKLKPVKIEGSKEYGLPQTLVEYAKQKPIKLEKVSNWRQNSDLQDLLRAEKELSKTLGKDNLSAIDEYFL